MLSENIILQTVAGLMFEYEYDEPFLNVIIKFLVFGS